MRFFDTIELGQAAEVSSMRETRNGSLVVHARAARGGNVQDYLGAEVGRPDMAVVRVYRDADEIFHKDSLKTFGHKAVTLDHPSEPVTSRTWKDVARGHTGDEVLRDGEFVKIPMLVADQAAIDAVKGGKRELSVGYQCDLDWTPGTSPTGEAYDARQIKITVDHVAIVDRGRAGPDCRIGDQRPSDVRTMRALSTIQRDTVPMKMHTVDGHSVEMSDAAIIAVTGLQNRVGTLTADNLKLTTDVNALRAASETKDGEIAALKQKLADAEMTPAKLSAAVAARAKVIGDAEKIAGAGKITVDGKSDAEIRRAAVAVKLGDAATALSDAAVEGAFAAFVADARPGDPLAATIAGGLQANDANSLLAARDKAKADRIARLEGAHRQTAA